RTRRTLRPRHPDTARLRRRANDRRRCDGAAPPKTQMRLEALPSAWGLRGSLPRRQTPRTRRSLLRMPAAFLHGTAHFDQCVLGTGTPAADQDQVLVRQDANDGLREHGANRVAVLPGHLQTSKGTTRRHIGTDRTAVTTILVRTVAVLGAREVVAAHYAGET